MITEQQYKEAKAIVKDYDKRNRRPKYDFDGVSKSTLLNNCMSTRLYNSIAYYCKGSVEKVRVGELKNINITRFASLEGVGAVQVRELKALCKAAGVEMKR